MRQALSLRNPPHASDERLAEYGWKPHREFLAQQQPSPAPSYLYMHDKQKGTVSSNSRFQTVLFRPYSAKLSSEELLCKTTLCNETRRVITALYSPSLSLYTYIYIYTYLASASKGSITALLATVSCIELIATVCIISHGSRYGRLCCALMWHAGNAVLCYATGLSFTNCYVPAHSTFASVTCQIKSRITLYHGSLHSLSTTLR